MKKKFLIKILSSIVVIGSVIGSGCMFSSCSYIEDKSARQKELLALEGQKGYYYITRSSFILDNEETEFAEFIVKKITDGEAVAGRTLEVADSEASEALEGSATEGDSASGADVGSIEITEENLSKISLSVRVDNSCVYYALRYNAAEDFSQADFLVGYIDFNTLSVVYYNVSIDDKYLDPLYANDRYFIFKQTNYHAEKSAYYLIDIEQNELICGVADISAYLDGTENDRDFVFVNEQKYEVVRVSDSRRYKNLLTNENSVLIIDYDYVLSRSDDMAKIDKITGQYKRGVFSYMLTFNNRLFVVMQSECDILGAGELIPVVFEYKIETDTFEYLGCTNKLLPTTGQTVIGVIPTNK